MRLLFSCLFFFAVTLPIRSEDLSVILKRMDASSPMLKTLSADINMLTVTAIIQDKITETGTLKIQKGKADSVRAVYDFPGQKTIGLFGKTVRIYYPKSRYYQDYDFGKNSDLVNQLLLLGFGSSGKDLAQSYSIKSEGTENFSGVTTTKLLLTPKDAKVQEHLSKVEIWIPVGEANPIQQQFYEPNDNYRVVTYTNVRVNPPIKGTLEIKMQSGTQKRSS